MALALASHGDVRVEVFHDERSAAFAALGCGLATGLPAVALCTSGTAATHFHAAVVEAALAGVPLLAVTADRPPELHGIGAPQTIDQHRLFTTSAPFIDNGVPTWSTRQLWPAQARAAWRLDGPAHLNVAFREPLLGAVIDDDIIDNDIIDNDIIDNDIIDNDIIDNVGASTSPSHRPTADPVLLRDVADRCCAHGRGVIIAGHGIEDAAAVRRLGDALRWPILADPRSGCRSSATEARTIAAFDSLLRDEGFAQAHWPTMVLHLGDPPASKVLGQWLRSSGAYHAQILGRQGTVDPLQIMDLTMAGEIGAACEVLASFVTDAGRHRQDNDDDAWRASWRAAEVAAQRAFSDVLCPSTAVVLTEPGVARHLSSRPGPLVVASSMPIRDIEWFGDPAQRATVYSNRGANGIDGVIATAIGVAVGSGEPTTVLLGDVAFCHDMSSLTALAHRDIHLKIVVTDNDGGAIFSFLPQAAALTVERFEQLFGTPHGTDIVGVALGHRLAASTVTTLQQLQAALDEPLTAVIRVPSQRADNTALHAQLHAAAAGGGSTT